MLNVQEQTKTSSEKIILAVPNRITVSRMLLLASFALGTFLRIWQINAMGYNTDEAVYSGQAAAIAGVTGLKDIFPVFRTHPLLVQFILSLVYKIDFNDLAGRLLAVVAGLGTIYVTYLIGKNLYSRMAGSIAAVLIALMPYHVIVSRQMLLDGPMVFFATLDSLYIGTFCQVSEKRMVDSNRGVHGTHIFIQRDQHCTSRSNIRILCTFPGDKDSYQGFAILLSLHS